MSAALPKLPVLPRFRREICSNVPSVLIQAPKHVSTATVCTTHHITPVKIQIIPNACTLLELLAWLFVSKKNRHLCVYATLVSMLVLMHTAFQEFTVTV